MATRRCSRVPGSGRSRGGSCDLSPCRPVAAENGMQEEKSDRLTRREMLVGMNAALLAAGTGEALNVLGAVSAEPPARAAPPAAGLGPHEVREIENTWIVMSDG